MERRPLALLGVARAQRLDVRSRAARAYLAKLARLQDAAVAQVRAAIPQAQIQERFWILLDGITVRLPARALPKLLRAQRREQDLSEPHLLRTMDRGPSVIHATDLQAATGDKGQGIKIGVVDTGVDSSNPFLEPGRLLATARASRRATRS